MLDRIQTDEVLFLDIETAPQSPDFDRLDETAQRLWELKAAPMCKDGQTPRDVYEKAGIYAEFGKIVCISAGFVYHIAGGQPAFRLKSYFDNDEKKLLNDFAEAIGRFGAQHFNMLLCAHNGREFDFPYIARRMLINGLTLPPIFDVAGKKPWEIPILDTMELWRFGDYKNFTSLKTLTYIFGIPSPKDDIDGSQVASVYWRDNDLPRIARYCEKDVLSIAQLLLRFKGMKPIASENVHSATDFTCD
jgi:uncharacterized protein YprB with RNaseH-like and TPR domain